MTLTDCERLRMLERPTGAVDTVIDTDTYNEIDDQFALAYALQSPEKINLKAIYAAPFHNEKSTSPADGMEKSFTEILNVLDLMNREELKPLVHRGSASYLPDEKTAVVSDAARHLAKLAQSYEPANPLYVVALGAITNIASAILLEPSVADRIVLIWLGGHAHHWPDNREFNLNQDIAAARIVFGCGVPLVQLPCKGVVSSFTVSAPELDYHLRGRNVLCDYLVDITKQEAADRGPAWTRVIWDVTAVGWLVSGEFVEDCLVHSPIPQYDDRYSFDQSRHFMRYVYHINRDELFEDLFAKLR